MKNRHVAALVVAGSLLLAGWSGASGQNAPAAGGGLQVLDFKPGFDDVMTMLVQPRHIKLYYAGREKNWELAAFELRELRASFRRAGQTIPVYRKQDVNKAVEVMATPQMDRVDKAIAAGDSTAFAAVYDALTTSCNTCHRVMEHAFLVMKVPGAEAASMYADQEFGSAAPR